MLRKLYGNPLAAIFMCLLLTAAGIVKFFGLPIALYPDTSRPTWALNLSYSGLEAPDFRQQYGDEIEGKLKNITGSERVEAFYHRGHAEWMVTFAWNHHQDKAQNDIKAAIATTESRFPKEWGAPYLYLKGNSSSSIFISLFSPTIPPAEMATLLEDRVKGQLEQIPGLEMAFVSRPFNDQVEVRLRPDKLAYYGIYPSDVRLALAAKEYNQNLGQLKSSSGGSLYFYVPLKDESLEALAMTPITVKGSGATPAFTIPLKTLAEVSFAPTPPTHLIKGNGQRGLIVGGKVKSSGNIAATCNRFEAIVREGALGIDPNLQIDVLVNPSLYIQEAITNVGEAVVTGIMIATLVIFLFLNSLRLTLIIAIAIPLSLIGGFIIMSLTDIELNLISLGAMALACGMVVDGSVVVLENIQRHLVLDPPRNRRDRLNTIYQAVSEVSGAVVASLITTIIVFAPLAFTAPLANAILGDLAKVMVCVLVISMGVTLITVPPLMLILGQQGAPKRHGIYAFSHAFQRAIGWLEALYLKVLQALITHLNWRRLFYAGLTLACCGSIYILTNHLRREIMAEPDTDKVWLVVEFQEQRYKIDEADAKVTPIEEIIKEEFLPELTHFFSQVYESGASILCNLKDKHQVNAFKARLEARFKNTPQAHYYVSTWSPSALEIPRPPLLSIQVLGESQEEKRALMAHLEQLILKSPKVGRVSLSPSLQQSQQIKVNFNYELLEQWQRQNLGVGREQIQDLITYALDDHAVKSIGLNGRMIPVKLGLTKDLITQPEDLRNLLVNVNGQLVPLRQGVHFSEAFSWDEYYADQGREEFKVEVFLKDTFKDDKIQTAEELMASIKADPELPGHKLAFGDTEAEINASISSLLYALGLALALVWLVVILQFASMRYSLIILSAIPLGFIGVALSLASFGAPLSVNSMLGLILLCGTAVNNSIIFVDFYEQLKGISKYWRTHYLPTIFSRIVWTRVARIL